MLKKSAANALIIINPKSGRRNPGVYQAIKKFATSLGWQGKITKATLKKDVSAITHEAIQNGVKYIIVGGGDGTVRDVVGDIAQHKIPLGIIPLGTGNIFAKNLKIPFDLESAVKTALSGKVKHIDLGKANENYFVLIAGMGLDVEAMRQADPMVKRRFGVLAYIWAGLKSISNRRRKYRIIIDDKKKGIVKAKSIMVANIGKTEAGIEIVPGAFSESGDLKIGIIKAKSILSWLEILINILKGHPQKSKDYILYKGKNVEIYPLSGPEAYECDGNDFLPTDKLTIKIYPASLPVVTPQ